MLAEGLTRAEIARREGVSRQWVTMFIRDNLPDLHGKGKEAALVRGAAARDAADRARIKRYTFRWVLAEARRRGHTWKTIAGWLGEPNWRRLQALNRDY